MERPQHIFLSVPAACYLRRVAFAVMGMLLRLRNLGKRPTVAALYGLPLVGTADSKSNQKGDLSGRSLHSRLQSYRGTDRVYTVRNRKPHV